MHISPVGINFVRENSLPYVSISQKSNIMGAIDRTAAEGDGTPTKNLSIQGSFFSDSSLVLNLASLIAAHTTKNNTAAQPQPLILWVAHIYIIIGGATPKLKKSAKESSCAPKVLVDFSNLASLPSMPSMKAATIIRITATSNFCFVMARFKAVRPAHRAINVRIFGISLMLCRARNFLLLDLCDTNLLLRFVEIRRY